MTQEQIEQKAIELMLDGHTWRDIEPEKPGTFDADFVYLYRAMQCIDIENIFLPVHLEADRINGFVTYIISDDTQKIDSRESAWAAAAWITEDYDIRHKIQAVICDKETGEVLKEYPEFDWFSWERLEDLPA